MINFTFTEGVLTLALEGRVDTANVAVVDGETSKIISTLTEKPWQPQ